MRRSGVRSPSAPPAFALRASARQAGSQSRSRLEERRLSRRSCAAAKADRAVLRGAFPELGRGRNPSNRRPVQVDCMGDGGLTRQGTIHDYADPVNIRLEIERVRERRRRYRRARRGGRGGRGLGRTGRPPRPLPRPGALPKSRRRAASQGRREKVRGRSSAGRALQWHCRGQGFDPPRLHQPSLKLRLASQLKV